MDLKVIRKLQGLIVAAIFLLLIVGLERLKPNQKNVYEADAPESILQTSPLRFREVSHELGVDVKHQLYFPNPETKSYLPLMSIPPSISVVDIDNDGYFDFYFVQPDVTKPNLFFRNKNGRGFEEIGEKLGLSDLPKDQPGSMAYFADFTRRGFNDVFLSRMGCHTFLQWDEHAHRFVKSDFLPEYCSNPKAINVVDFNKDGWLDVIFGNYYPETDLKTYLPLSHVFGQAGYQSGGSAEILLGSPRGFFHPPLESFRALRDLKAHTTSIGIHDFDGDGYPDLFLSNDYYFDALLKNEKGIDVSDATHLIPSEEHGFSGMNSEWADFDNSGILSLYVTNMYVPPFVTAKNILWKWKGDKFDNVAGPAGVARCGWAWGAKFADFDNDGFLDLFVINGKARGLGVHTAEENTKSFSFVRNTLAATPPTFRYDMDLYPDFTSYTQSGFERNCMYWQKDGHFYDVTKITGINDLEEGQSIALIDYDNDGRMDILVGNNGGPLLIYHNETPVTGHWIGVHLIGPETAKDALGSKAQIELPNGQLLTREKNPGNGYRGQSDPRLHFGLGALSAPVSVQVTWWDGRKEVFKNLPTDRYVALHYGEGEK